MCSCCCGLQGDNSGKVIMSEDLLKFILMRCRLERREKKMRSSWCGWGRCLIFLKVEMYPSHPPFCHNRLVFFILSNRFFPLKSWRRGGGKWPFGPQDKLIEKCWHQMKGGLLTWWVGFLPLASAACWDHVSARLSQGLLIARLGTRHEELPLARLGHPQKITSTLPTLHSFSPPPSRANSRSGEARSVREWENKVHGV